MTAVGSGGFIPYPGYQYFRNDLWYYNLTSSLWVEVVPEEGYPVPEPRMEPIFLLVGDLIFMHGTSQPQHFSASLERLITLPPLYCSIVPSSFRRRVRGQLHLRRHLVLQHHLPPLAGEERVSVDPFNADPPLPSPLSVPTFSHTWLVLPLPFRWSRFVRPIYPEECTDDFEYIATHDCVSMAWPKHLERDECVQYF